MPIERIGVTGHQDLPEAAVEFVSRKLSNWYPNALGTTIVCSLARGADTLIAELLMARGARLHVIVPAKGYAETFAGEDLARYERLLDEAEVQEFLGFEKPTEEAYMAAGSLVVSSSDWLIAVWDGEPAKGLGGTGDVVDLALRLGKDVRVLWPEGVSR